MKIIPVAQPQAPQPSANSPAASSARERAIAALMGGNPSPQEAPISKPVEQAATPQNHNENPKPDAEAASSLDNQEEPKAAEAEAPKEVTETKEEPLSAQYAILARKEKALRAKIQSQQQTEQAIKAREEALAAREADLKAKDAEYSSKYISKDRLKDDLPTILRNELGMSDDEITQLMLSQPAPQDTRARSEISELKSYVQKLEKRLEESQKSSEEKEQNSYKQAVNQIRSEVRQLVTSDPSYEMIKETNSAEDVVQLIEKTFKKDGIFLSAEEAAQEIEEYLVEEALRIAKSKKIQQKLAPAAAQKPQEPQKQQQTMKTLTNSVSANRKLTNRERAILVAQGKQLTE